MILVDTSIWVEHLRSSNRALQHLLGTDQVICRAFIIGELALGGSRNRKVILDSIRDLPQASVANHAEIMGLIERQSLQGIGIGYVVHICWLQRVGRGAGMDEGQAS